MSTQPTPELIFGCGGIGEEFKDADSILELFETLRQSGVKRLDTAALYPPTNIGASQRLLGDLGASQKGFTIDTKVLISMKNFQGTLEPEKISQSVVHSHNDLKFEEGQRINVYYAHVPNNTTPLKDQAFGFDVQYRKGLFDKLGVCNFSAEMLSEFIDICEREGYVKPSVYEGVYNIIDRRHEGKVFDLVRKHGMQFVAHSPHGSGFLHGALTSGEVEGTRFSEGNLMSIDARRYDKEKYHEVIRYLKHRLAPSGIQTTEAAHRWVAFHSQLGPKDAMIFGSSKIAQVKQNIAALGKGPLPEDIVSMLDGVWGSLQAV